MIIYSHIQKLDGKIPSFNPSAPKGESTRSHWKTDEKEDLFNLSDAKVATFEQIDDYAESIGLTAWRNNH